MPLTATAVKNAKPRAKPYKMADGKGLFLLVTPKGGKWWRYKYRYHRKEKLLALGTYPDVSLKDARDLHDKSRKILAKGIDPSEVKKIEKAAGFEQSENSFQAVAVEWITKFSPNWTPEHAKRISSRFKADIFPWLGARPINQINSAELLRCLRRIESRGALDTAHRAMQNCGQVFRYAVASGQAERDPTTDLRGALPPVRPKHHSSITDPAAVGALMRAIDGYEGYFVTKCALRLAPLLFVRPGELRQAEWDEISLDKSEWRIPAEKMKAGEQHIVPLSQLAVEILTELKPLTGPQGYVFPGIRSRKRPMSENTINAALRRLGYTKEEMTGHGFRSMASTLLNEQGWHHDAIERQLAHAERNNVRAAYNFAEHLPERRKMMQAWADYLDSLKAGADVVSLKSKCK
jgi:integrase